MGTAQLGDQVKDIVSGSSGIVIGHCKWLTGCDTFTVKPPIKEDGSKIDNFHIDITRAEVIEAGVVKLKNDTPVTRGGPQPHGSPSRASA